MYQALPYKTWHTTNLFPASPPFNNLFTSSSNGTVAKTRHNTNMKSLIDENAVIIFGRRGCCMSHVVRRLLLGLGVNPNVYDVDEQDEQSVFDELNKMSPTGNAVNNCPVTFPTVFIGGRWFGDLDRIIATHITGELTPILKDAGALWL
ncbi:hypothetical protein BVRB_9g209480 [Beta vulgaris subsp. vulgaris]|nr:hypothetical protein BVRB_9g209480 [Beta vulgaris subsp. vulgaris]